MRRCRIVNQGRFEIFKNILALILAIVLLVLFVRFMDAHDGLGAETAEYRVYEVVQETSSYNHRVKTPVLREVVYKTAYR